MRSGWHVPEQSDGRGEHRIHALPVGHGGHPNRSSYHGHPGGKFAADYEFSEGSGDLDECNGHFDITPDFPNGTYA